MVYLFLPLAHVFAQMVQFAAVSIGATLVFWGGDVTRIVPELAEVRPTFLPVGAAHLREGARGPR